MSRMNILVVTAHPLKDSLCRTLADHIVSRLKNYGHTISIEDLYETDFDPVLSNHERERYYSDRYDTTAVANEVQRLEAAEALVMVFPTWWFGFPAVLKGWFDRVWVPSVAYDHASDYGPIRPRLNDLRKAFVVTTLGAPWWVDYLILRRPVKRTLRFALLGACARKCRLKYLSFYKCEQVVNERMRRIKSRIDEQLSKFFG
jgi:putative NADPH-quinone reductase